MKKIKLLIITITAFLAYSELDISLKDTCYIASYALPFFQEAMFHVLQPCYGGCLMDLSLIDIFLLKKG